MEKRSTLVAAFIGAGLALAGLSSPARAVDCATAKQPQDKRICSYVMQGPDVFRRFIERTQGIYQIYYWDYVQDRAEAPDDATVAKAHPRQSRAHASKPS